TQVGDPANDRRKGHLNYLQSLLQRPATGERGRLGEQVLAILQVDDRVATRAGLIAGRSRDQDVADSVAGTDDRRNRVKHAAKIREKGKRGEGEKGRGGKGEGGEGETRDVIPSGCEGAAFVRTW